MIYTQYKSDNSCARPAFLTLSARRFLRKLTLNKGDSFLAAVQLSVELSLFHAGQYPSDRRPRFESESKHIFPGYQLCRPNDLRWGCLEELPNIFVRLQIAIAGKAVQAVQRQVLLKSRQSHEPLQRSRPHPRHVFKPHVMFHQRKDLLGIVIREFQPSQNLPRDRHAHFHVPIESDPVSRLIRGSKRRWLAHIMQEHAPRQGRWRSRRQAP